jgi:hypothetical protein
MRGLIGYTGFVGSNLLNQTEFDKLYNSKNINNIKGEKFEFLVCAGAPAVKWKANKYPDEDLATIELLIENLKHVECEELVLISTVDVYTSPIDTNEDTKIVAENLMPYGKHRFMLENFVKEKFPSVTIIRLPGLFGDGLKKNIIYDFLNNNCLHLVNSENIFQFYNLARLYKDICTCIDNNIKLVNFATEPVKVKDIVQFAFNRDFDQITEDNPIIYDMKTKYSTIFKSEKEGYILSKDDILQEIKGFVVKELSKGVQKV